MLDNQAQQLPKIHPVDLTDDVFLIAHAETLRGISQIERLDATLASPPKRLFGLNSYSDNREHNVVEHGWLQMSDGSCRTRPSVTPSSPIELRDKTAIQAPRNDR